MATPFGHSLAGYAVYSSSGANRQDRGVKLILLSVFMAVAPDLDLLPGLLLGKPVLYHGSITHSLGFAFGISLGIATLYHLRGKPFSAIFKLCFIAYTSHLVLDFIGPDGRTPYGIPLFWPLSAEHFISPVPLLLGAHHVSSTSASTPEFIKGVLNFYNLAAIALEAILIVPFIFLRKLYRNKKDRDLLS